MVVDVNNDGKPDILCVNNNGSVRALINNSSERYIKIIVKDNVEYIGKETQMVTMSGRVQAKQIANYAVLMTDQTPNLFFALPSDEELKEIVLVDNYTKTKSILDLPDDKNLVVPK